jgi:hypothetical protein
VRRKFELQEKKKGYTTLHNESEVLGIWTLSVVRHFKQVENMAFRKLDLFPSSRERRETPTLLGPFRIS